MATTRPMVTDHDDTNGPNRIGLYKNELCYTHGLEYEQDKKNSGRKCLGVSLRDNCANADGRQVWREGSALCRACELDKKACEDCGGKRDNERSKCSDCWLKEQCISCEKPRDYAKSDKCKKCLGMKKCRKCDKEWPVCAGIYCEGCQPLCKQPNCWEKTGKKGKHPTSGKQKYEPKCAKCKRKGKKK